MSFPGAEALATPREFGAPDIKGSARGSCPRPRYVPRTVRELRDLEAAMERSRKVLVSPQFVLRSWPNLLERPLEMILLQDDLPDGLLLPRPARPKEIADREHRGLVAVRSDLRPRIAVCAGR